MALSLSAQSLYVTPWLPDPACYFHEARNHLIRMLTTMRPSQLAELAPFGVFFRMVKFSELPQKNFTTSQRVILGDLTWEHLMVHIYIVYLTALILETINMEKWLVIEQQS